MKPILLLRIASILILLNALGHTIGHVRRKDNPDPAIQAVIRQMEENKFEFGGSVRSLDDFLAGNSLVTSVTLFVIAALLWILSGQSKDAPRNTATLLVPQLAAFIANAVISQIYFFAGPMIFQLVVAALVIAAIVQLNKSQAKVG